MEIARLMVELVPNIEMVRMVNSAPRPSCPPCGWPRGPPGGDKLIKFEGCYHGHPDCMLVNAGSSALAGHPPHRGRAGGERRRTRSPPSSTT